MNTEQPTLFETDKLRTPKADKTKLEILTQQLGKLTKEIKNEIEATRPITDREKVDAAVTRIMQMRREHPKVSDEAFLWMIGNQMKKQLMRLNKQDKNSK